MPYSLSWFGFTAAILLLQWVPFTGVVLLFFGAPLWPIATINLGFACLFVEALVRPGFRLWLLAPLLYFGSYAIAATLSHVEAEAIDRELRAINAGKTVAFSPARHDIVVARLGNPGLSRLPETLVQHYGLAVSFDEVDVGNTSSTRSQRVASEPLCDEIQRNAAMEAAGHSASRFRRDPSDTRKLCIVSGTENPTRPVYRVSARRSARTGSLNTSMIDEVSIRDPSGDVTRLAGGSSAVLATWPQPMIGCLPYSGLSSCFARFIRVERGLGAQQRFGSVTVPIVVAALGIEPASYDALARNAIHAMPPSLAEYIERHAELALTKLDVMLKDPDVSLSPRDIAGLRERPARWRERIDEMLVALERSFDGPARIRASGFNIQMLLASLHDDDYSTVARRILTLLSARPDLSPDAVLDKTLERLWLAGPDAISVLSHRLHRTGQVSSATSVRGKSRFVSSGAMLGMCRIGPAAAALAERVARPYVSQAMLSEYESYFVGMITLIRLGRADLAEQLREKANWPDRRMPQQIAERLAKSSSPADCRTWSEWRQQLKNEQMQRSER